MCVFSVYIKYTSHRETTLVQKTHSGLIVRIIKPINRLVLWTSKSFTSRLSLDKLVLSVPRLSVAVLSACFTLSKK